LDLDKINSVLDKGWEKPTRWNSIAAFEVSLANAKQTSNYKCVDLIVERFPSLRSRIASGYYGDSHPLFKKIIKEDNDEY
jgi:hypothetical protein